MLNLDVNIRQTQHIRNLQTHKVQVTVAQNAHGHKQRTLEPPVLRCRTVAGTTYFGAFYAAAASGR